MQATGLFLPQWWLTFFFIGLACWPLVRRYFSHLPAQGYALAKILGLVLISYFSWLGGLARLLPFTQVSLIAVGLGLGLTSRLLTRSLPPLDKKTRRQALGMEILFLVGFLTLAFIRAHQPDIRGLEKYMDHGFVVSILKSRFFPPLDMWFAGGRINYYYFGHLLTAVAIKIAQVPDTVGYNLMISTIAGLTLTLSFNFSQTLIKKLTKNKNLALSLGLLSALLVTFGGNLQPLYHLLKEGSLDGYWYADATRFIVEKFGAADNTIHEFPGYSFIVADLHGHLNNLPIALLLSLIILSLFLNRRQKMKTRLPYFVLFGFLAGVGFMTNAWDLPIYYLWLGLTLLFLNFKKSRPLGWFKPTFLLLLPALITSFLTITPFLATFENIAQGIALVDFRSPVWMLVFLWGLPLLTTATIIKLWPKLKQPTARFFFALLIGGWLLILIPELIRVKDIYHIKHQRANTMFKLTYQAFVMFGLLVGPTLGQLVTRLKNRFAKLGLLALFAGLIVICLIYPYFGFRSYYFGSQAKLTLDGARFLKTYYPNDYQAIGWLKNNLAGQPVILEAVGESYSDFGRVSVFTGLPTVVGWPVHEWLWRADQITPYQRLQEVRQIYENTNDREALRLLQKYQVEYVFLGQLERQAYPNLDQAFFEKYGKPLFTNDQTVVYRLTLPAL